MRFLLVALTGCTLHATIINHGNLSGPNSNVTCLGGSQHPFADCRVEYATNATMPLDNFAGIIQSSAGNRSTNTSTSELFILDFSGSNVVTRDTDQWAWVNGTTYQLTITYNATTRAFTYVMSNGAGQSVTLNGTLGAALPITDVFFRTQAQTPGSSLLINNIRINNVNIPNASSEAIESQAQKQVTYLWLSGLESNFTINADIRMSWGATAPSGTSVVSYIKFGQAQNPSTYAPEPGALGLGAAGILLIVIGARRRKRPAPKSLPA